MFKTLHTKQMNGCRWCWQFLEKRQESCVPCCVWPNGSSCYHQLKPSGSGCGGESWWPCIVCELADSDELAFYCPALAWGDARPWGAHHSRVRSVRRELLQWAIDSPTTAPSIIAASGTSSAAGYDEMSDSVISDVMSEVGSEADWGGVWQRPN